MEDEQEEGLKKCAYELIHQSQPTSRGNAKEEEKKIKTNGYLNITYRQMYTSQLEKSICNLPIAVVRFIYVRINIFSQNCPVMLLGLSERL